MVDRASALRPALIVHDGAWDIPEDEKDAHLEGVRRAFAAGWDVLEKGGSAIDAVTAAVVVMENDPALNCGRGSVLCREGWVEMDCGLMDGHTLDVGAAANLKDIRNPILLAREVLGSEHVLLVGGGAGMFARERGVRFCDPRDLVVEREKRRLTQWLKAHRPVRTTGPADTVGAVAIDRDGHLAAGASTGGTIGKRPGRVGDTPIVGCGFYAEDGRGAAACTGEGEKILRVALARRAVELGERLPAMEACRQAIGEMRSRVQGEGGVILIARDGSVGYGFNTPSMAVAHRDASQSAPVVGGVVGR